MHPDTYIEAILPEPFTVLGLPLRPLSIGHLVLLHRIGSPFVAENGEVSTLDDLANACLICSSTFAEGAALLDDPELPQKLIAWGRLATNQHGWRGLFPWLYKPIDLKVKLELFCEYLRYHLEAPCYSVEEGKGRAINAPSWQVIRMVLLSKTNLTDTEIMDRPYRQCVTDFLTLRAIEGQLQLEDAQELEEARRLANELAATLKARGNHD